MLICSNLFETHQSSSTKKIDMFYLCVAFASAIVIVCEIFTDFLAFCRVNIANSFSAFSI